MKRYTLLYFFCALLSTTLWGQQSMRNARDFGSSNPNMPQSGMNSTQNSSDSLSAGKTSNIAPNLKMWTVSERFGNSDSMAVDTTLFLFQNSNLMEGSTGHINYTGNLGAPAQTRLFFERPLASNYAFTDPYFYYVVPPSKFKFTDTKSPYTNISYFNGGSKHQAEERFKTYFSVNANKQIAFGFNIDYLYGRGLYVDQNTAHFNGAVFGSYNSDHYNLHLIYNSYSIINSENGGIKDDRYITDPQAMSEGKKEYQSNEIPTNFTNMVNRDKNYYLFMTHRYNLGFQRKKNNNDKDSSTVFVPISSFIHTLKYEDARHRFKSDSINKGAYRNYYLDPSGLSNDQTFYTSLKNTFAISLREGFNRYAKAGLAVFVENDLRTYKILTQTDQFTTYREHASYIGGELSKQKGAYIHYKATGEVGIIGADLGTFKLNGVADLNLHIGRDTLQLKANAKITNTNAPFLTSHFHTNYYWWDLEFTKENRTRIEAELSSKRTQTTLRVGVENVKNYLYYDSLALPKQHTDNIQVVSATLKQNFKLGHFHLDNEAVYQKSSNKQIIPLPELSLYHNFYIQASASKVLTFQLGADVRYFTAYFAPNYQPATQQYHLQTEGNEIEIGNYPMVNLYFNAQLKRTRFYAMLYHVNQRMGNSNYFLAPHYPIDPQLFKIGISWNFYD